MENEIEDAYNKMDPIYMEEYGFYDSWEILSEKLLKDLLTDDRENNNNKIYPYKTCVRIAFKLFANDNGNLCMIPAYTQYYVNILVLVLNCEQNFCVRVCKIIKNTF